MFGPMTGATTVEEQALAKALHCAVVLERYALYLQRTAPNSPETGILYLRWSDVLLLAAFLKYGESWRQTGDKTLEELLPGLAEQRAWHKRTFPQVPSDETQGDFEVCYDAAKRLEGRLAAEQGNASAQYNLGLMYDNGQGVTQDYAEAVKWYRLAAEQGDADAQYNLALMYRDGQGVTQDDAEAVKWYRLAAGQGVAQAQYNLGWMYDNGQGVVQDYAEAVKWYRLAAEQGYAQAQNNLGVMYDNGHGVVQDYISAHMWFNIAAALGNKKGKENRDIVAKKMTPADISKAQKLAREWMEKHPRQ